jgi:preprotein translocase subunit SecA
MRIFAGDKMQSLLNNQRIGLREGEALEHPLISKMLEHAQRKVEQMHFEVRKNLLKFDDVMNEQRKEVYEQRREIMETKEIDAFAKDMRYDLIEDIVSQAIPKGSYPEQWDMELLQNEAQRLLALDIPAADWAKEEGIADEEILERVTDLSDRKIAAKAANVGPDVWQHLQRTLMLQILDQHWKEHLLNLDHLRQGINLRAFGQRDPLNEYKTEAYAMFETMVLSMREHVTQMLCMVEISVDEDQARKDMAKMRQKQAMEEGREDPAMKSYNAAPPMRGAGVTQFTRRTNEDFDAENPDTWGRVKRNAPCPCGSGKKFKHCHGAMAAQKA